MKPNRFSGLADPKPRTAGWVLPGGYLGLIWATIDDEPIVQFVLFVSFGGLQIQSVPELHTCNSGTELKNSKSLK